MSKEVTAYVVDLKQGDQLELGLKYVYDSIAAKLLKRRVTDYVTILACNSSVTNHPFDEVESLQGLNVLSRKVAPTLTYLRQWLAVFGAALPEFGGTDSGGTDPVLALLVAVAMMGQDTKGVFIRNIVVVTGETDSDFTGELAESTVDAVNTLDINVTVILTSEANERNWKNLVSRYKNGVVVSANDVESILSKNPPLKRVDPRPSFKGTLRLGVNPHLVNEDAGSSLSWQVEMYPGTMRESFPPLQSFLVGDQITPLSTSYDYYVELEKPGDTEEPQKEKIKVEKGDWVDGFRYTNRDIQALDDTAKAASKLPCSPSLDILGFMNLDDLPIAYFTNDSRYLVPSKLLLGDNLVGFDGLCSALLETKMIAIVRFVQKMNDEINLCALIPGKAKVTEDYVHIMQIVRLPFKEDEKIGNFPPLKSDDNLDLMDQFVLSRDLDEGESGDHQVISNEKINLLSHQTIANKIKSGDESTDAKLLSCNPALHKFQAHLYKIMQQASKAENVREYLEDPDFLNKYMVSDSTTNLFNLTNVLFNKHSITNPSWLQKINATDSVTEKLAKSTKPFRPKAKKRRLAASKQGAGTYGEEEGDYEVVDIDALLQ